MAARLQRLSAAGRAWVLLAGLLFMLSLGHALAGAGVDPWAWRRDQPGQVWRWWTAALVHWNTLHLLANLAGTAAVAWLGWAARLPAGAALAWLLAWPLTQVLLWLADAPARYAGLSGVLHAGVAVAAVYLLLQAAALRWIGGALAVGLLVKIASETPWQAAVVASTDWGFPVAVAAHASGAVAGAAVAVTGVLTLRLQARLSPPASAR